MSDTYSPAKIGNHDAESIVSRVTRYVRRHGSEYGETPVPGGDIEEAVAVIVADWLGADWLALEYSYRVNTGRDLFPVTLIDMGRHLRAALHCCGRAKRRGWAEAGPMRRAARRESRRRDWDDSAGVGMASRSPDPARVAAAVEEAQRVGLMSTPDRFKRRRLRWAKSRNSHRVILTITRPAPAVIREDGVVTYREGAYTGVQFERVTVHNFRRAGDIPFRVEDNGHYTPVYGIGRVVRSRPNPAIGKTRNRIPAGVTAAALREAITG